MTLPPLPPACLVNSQETLSHMLAALKKQSSIAIDTESNSLHAYQERVCLIQISTEHNDYIIDPDHPALRYFTRAYELRGLRWPYPLMVIDPLDRMVAEDRHIVDGLRSIGRIRDWTADEIEAVRS